MRVLLAMPNSANDVRDSLGFVSPPLGLGYIASYLREIDGHDVRIHDGILLRSSDADLMKVFQDYHPSVVGISAQATPSAYDVYRTARMVKAIDSDCQVVVGGAHASFTDDTTLKECPDIDYVVRGEGEIVMSELLRALDSGNVESVKGITYRRKDSIKRNPRPPPIADLDSLPFPAYDLMDLSRYFTNGVRVGTMVSSRGCPFTCTFCSSSRASGKKWRGRSAENVVSEIELLVDKYGVNELEFLDDLFSYDPQRVREICELIEEHNLHLGWTCSVRADILSANPQMSNWLKEAGCHAIYMGVESGSQRVLNLMRKGTTLHQIWASNAIAKKAKLNRIFSFVLGYPGEARNEARSTIDIACRLDPDIAQFTICTPYPGTPLYEHARKEGSLRAKSWRDFSVLYPVLANPNFSAKEIRYTLYSAYLRFYLRLSYIWKQMRAKNVYFFRKLPYAIWTYLKRRSKLSRQQEQTKISELGSAQWISIHPTDELKSPPISGEMQDNAPSFS